METVAKKDIDLNKAVELIVKSRFDKIKRSSEPQKIPLCVNVVSEEIEIEGNRPALDLIMCIDVSGSMSGEKIQMVKDTLLFVVDELKDFDRMSLIEFDSAVNVLTHLNPMTEKNK